MSPGKPVTELSRYHLSMRELRYTHPDTLEATWELLYPNSIPSVNAVPRMVLEKLDRAATQQRNGETQGAKATMTQKELDKRWQDRVVANNWHNMGAAGAVAYLNRYGKNIGPAKTEALAAHADSVGCADFAAVLRGSGGVSYFIDTITEKTVVEEDWNGDTIDMHQNVRDCGNVSKYVRGSADEFARRNIGSQCGGPGPGIFDALALKYPLIQIRGCLDATDNVVGCVDIYVDSDAHSLEVEELLDPGCFRTDGMDSNDVGSAWVYYECE
jgi:hypothetical protein